MTALDHHDVSTLLAAAESGGLDDMTSDQGSQPRHREIHRYDFKRPERVSKEQMRALEAMHQTFARNFGASLSAFLRTIVEVRVATAEQLTYSEFIHSLPNPTNFNLLTAEPLQGQMCLEISPLIIYPIIDRLLGGSQSELFIPQRPLTLIEQRLVGQLTARALTCLREAWNDLADVKFAISEVESNPHLVQIVAPNDVVVVIGFEIKMGGRVGTMSLCIPYNVIEPVMSKLVSQGWLAYQRRGDAEKRTEDISRGIGVTEVTLVAYLAETTVTVRDMLSLQPGDIIQTEKPVGTEVIIQVEGRNKYAGQIGRHKRNLAVRVTRPAQVEEPI